MKLGGALQKLKAIMNYGAPAIGSAVMPTQVARAKLDNAVARYTGYHPGTKVWSSEHCLDAWQGIATTALIQYADAKTRHYGNISRMKLLDIAEEAIPILQVYDRGGDMGNMAVNYNGFTTGYGALGDYGTYAFDNVKPYATMKAIRIGLDMFGARSWINKRLPKGINL